MQLTSAESTQLPKTIMQRTGPGKQNQVVFLLFCPVPKRQQVTVALCSPKNSEGSKSKSVKLQGQCNGFGCCVQYSIGNYWNVSGNSLKGRHVGSFQCVQDTCRTEKRGERQELVQMIADSTFRLSFLSVQAVVDGGRAHNMESPCRQWEEISSPKD